MGRTEGIKLSAKVSCRKDAEGYLANFKCMHSEISHLCHVLLAPIKQVWWAGWGGWGRGDWERGVEVQGINE